MKFKSEIAGNIDPIQLADEMKLSVFKGTIERLKRLEKLTKAKSR